MKTKKKLQVSATSRFFGFICKITCFLFPYALFMKLLRMIISIEFLSLLDTEARPTHNAFLLVILITNPGVPYLLMQGENTKKV